MYNLGTAKTFLKFMQILEKYTVVLTTLQLEIPATLKWQKYVFVIFEKPSKNKSGQKEIFIEILRRIC